MTASEFQSLESHSDTTICSGLYTKTPKWSSKVHASKLLKGVLISRTLNSTSSDQDSGSTSTPNNPPARGKRAFSSDSALSSSSLIPKKSSSQTKTACLCAPTKHAGSFRCRLHRVTQKHWGGRSLDPGSPSKASSSTSLPANENSGNVAVVPWSNGLFVPPTGCMSKTGAARPSSRLRVVVVAAQAEDVLNPVDYAATPKLSEGCMNYIKVAATTMVKPDNTDAEPGAPASGKLINQ